MIALTLVATLVTAGLCLGLIPLARKTGMVDHPGDHKVHELPTPLTGGPALLITSGLMMLFLYEGSLLVQGLAMGGLLMFVVGMIDDYRPLSASVRFLVQVVACMIIIVYSDVWLDDFGRLFWDDTVTLGRLSIPLTVFAAMGVINSFNMIDGMDGVSGSIFMVAAGGMALLAGMAQQFNIYLLLLVAFSAVFGYLLLNARFPWNPKARVFMGDSGSQFLGFFLAGVSFHWEMTTMRPGSGPLCRSLPCGYSPFHCWIQQPLSGGVGGQENRPCRRINTTFTMPSCGPVSRWGKPG